jgi:hypothetical protein
VSTFSLTCCLAQRNAVKLVKNFFGVKDIKEARRRLDRLLQEQVATTTAHIHEIVHGHAEIMKKLMDGDGEQRHMDSNSPSIEYPALWMAKYQLTVSEKLLVCFASEKSWMCV